MPIHKKNIQGWPFLRPFGSANDRLVLGTIASCLIFFLLGCQDSLKNKGKIRIGVASFSHETCTFAPELTTAEDFEKGGVFHGNDVLAKNRGKQTYINGFIKEVQSEKEVELVGILDASRAWGGSSKGWLTGECFDKYTGLIVEGIKKAGRLDGVLLALHGGMATEGVLKPEAEIVRRVRRGVGPIPIMVTLDLHANEDHELTDAADGVFIQKTYPHIDYEEVGSTAARCLVETIRGNFKPTVAIRKPGVITPSVFQGTGFSPAKDIMERAKEWGKKEKDGYCVSVAFGYAYADVPDGGATVIAVTNNNKELAERIAEDVSNFIWDNKEIFAGKRLPKTQEGVAQALSEAKAGKTPVIVADHSDRSGDSTHILTELIKQGAKNIAIATIADEGAINEIRSQAGIGEAVNVEVGGHATALSGLPVRVSGKVEFFGPCEFQYRGPMRRGITAKLGEVAVVGFGENNHIIITPTLYQVLDDAIFPAVGLDLSTLDLVVLKSRVHFRAFFDGVAGSIVVIDSPGLGPADLTQLDYRNLPEDIYPVGQKWQK